MQEKSALNLLPELQKDLKSIQQTGIYPYQHILELIRSDAISAESEITDKQVQPASLDLRLGPVAHRVQASFLPGPGKSVQEKLADLTMSTLDLSDKALFDKRCVYVVKLLEELALPSGISAKANPKSTTGRLDVFTRLIVDGAEEFDHIPAGYKGPLYAEIHPSAFSIVVAQGATLNQIRFFRGKPESSDRSLSKLDVAEKLVFVDEDTPGRADIRSGLRLSINLSGESRTDVIGYKAKPNAPAVDLSQVGAHDPDEFWEPVYPTRRKNLVLNPGDFYILASKEKVRVPPQYAAELVPFDPSIGEFRIHYAGFFDPGFGYGASDINGTLAVLEVRAHEVPFLVEDGQTIGRLVYARLIETPEKIYGRKIGSSYQRQGIKLSKQFKEFDRE